MKRRPAWLRDLAAVVATVLALVILAPLWLFITLWLHEISGAPLFLHEEGEAEWWFEPATYVLLVLYVAFVLWIGWRVWRRHR